ncbi:baseplate J/gp47 family protein [Porphyrobacter sp. YT40]|uniref:baseplate J/gp47 family protein n=1 Tax=Porphyrobacter sp. YT40 TaxID=2547601 RepID=UPI00114269D9|nr:baseplate J/gp47 family protein [Porphyrobacter sp. YT40]QDH33206.1 putative baseplate assembly protein [Porphyrobacter sp. YT40]
MSWPSGDPRRQARAELLRAAAAVPGATPTNGIIAVEVIEAGGEAVDLRLELVFDAATSGPARVRDTDIAISGGQRRPTVAVAEGGVTASGRVLTVRVPRRGDFSLYTLRLERGGVPLPGFDPLLSAIPVGFRLQCAQNFDCETPDPADEAPLAQAAIDYLARDYAGFRRLMLDRFAALSSGWRDPGPASAEVTLIEMLAHLADRLAYAQDSVATEATLDTARMRISAKRHARLVDYHMSDGCSARAFVHVRMTPPGPGRPANVAGINPGARFLTAWTTLPPAGPDARHAGEARVGGAQVFEAVLPAQLTSAHNRIEIHDYAGGLSELPRGTTGMALADPDGALTLAVGDLLLIEEVLDTNGNASPDPARRHVVRITQRQAGSDPVGAVDGGGNPVPLQLLHVAWSPADALPFALPLARVAALDSIEGLAIGSVQPTAVARGNMVLVDHGEGRGYDSIKPLRAPGRRRVFMTLSQTPVAFALPTPRAEESAQAMLVADPSRAAARIDARQDVGAGGDPVWELVPEMFDARADSRVLALDVDDLGRGVLRTGDGISGRIPEPDTAFDLRYRIGGGSIGNVGAESISHLLTDAHIGLDGALVTGFSGQAANIAAIRNPLPATGGRDPESIAEARLRAPLDFRDPRRAVTPQDYAKRLLDDPDVTNAHGIERWTGAERAIVLLVDLANGAALTDAVEARLRRLLEPYRLAGHVLEFRTPVMVPLELAMRVCVRPQALRDKVHERLLQVFSSGRFADGSTGLFHPDSFSFGTPLLLSRLYAAAQAVDGVRHVDVTRLRRQGIAGASDDALETGQLLVGDYEIPLLANDPNFPDRGTVTFMMEGGR